jgi:ElaB/YqjD/DUF883 family membrane-anchored ribosome-binding protein
MAGSNKSKSSSASSKNQNQQANGSSDDLGTAAAEAGEQIQQQVGNLTEQVRQQANTQLMSQKEKAVEALDTVALLLHQAGEHAHQQDKAMLAGYVDKASGQVGQWSETLRDRELTEIIDDTKEFARRQPMLFVGGALAAGFLGARFLRSSSQPQEQEQGQTGTSSLGGGSSASDMPPYDIDQYGSGSDASALDMPIDTTTSLQGDISPEASGFLEDYESAVLEGDDLGEISEAELDDLTSPETL